MDPDVAFRSPGSDTSNVGRQLNASQDDDRYVLESVASCDPQAEATELACAEALFDRLLRVYTSPDPFISVDRATVIEHVHQAVMYGRLLAGHLLGYHSRQLKRDEEVLALRRLLAEQAEELQCVGNARDAACADQARLTDELADSGKRVRELEMELSNKTSELAAQVTLCKKQSIQLDNYAKRLENAARKLSEVSLVTKLSSESVTGDSFQARPRIERQGTASPPRVNTDSIDEALREVALGFDIPLTTVEASPASTNTPVVSMRRDTAMSCESFESSFSCDGLLEDEDFQLAETYTTNQNVLLDQFSQQLNELTEAVHAETNSRRRAETDYTTLLQRFTGLCKLYSERCSDPSAAQTTEDANTVALIGRVLSPMVSLSEVRQALNQSIVSQRPLVSSPTPHTATSVADAFAPQSPDNPFNSPRAAAHSASQGANVLLSPVALPMNSSVASSHRVGLPRCGELLEAMQAYVCEVDHNDSANAATRTLFSDAVGNVTALSQPGQGGSDLFATSASGRIQEVFSVLNVMRKMCGRGGQTSKFDMSSSETAVTERSARCMQFLTYIVRVARLLEVRTSSGLCLSPQSQSGCGVVDPFHPFAAIVAGGVASVPPTLSSNATSASQSMPRSGSRSSYAHNRRDSFAPVRVVGYDDDASTGDAVSIPPAQKSPPHVATASSRSGSHVKQSYRRWVGIGSGAGPVAVDHGVGTTPARSGSTARTGPQPSPTQQLPGSSTSGELLREFPPHHQKRGSISGSVIGEEEDVVRTLHRDDPPRTAHEADLHRLSHDPGINYQRLQTFFVKCLTDLGEQWLRMCQIAGWVCESSGAGTGTMTPPQWQKDADAPRCGLCRVDFRVFVRRHHCRCCGFVFCGSCSSKTYNFMESGLAFPGVSSGSARRGSVLRGAVSGSSTESGDRVCDLCYAVLLRLPPLGK